MSHEFKYELDKLRQLLITHRTVAYMHALAHAGYCEESIRLAIENNEDWIKSGDWTGAAHPPAGRQA